MKSKIKSKEEAEYWQHRPGYNYHIGFNDGKVYAPSQTSGMKEVCLDRAVKDGKKLNK